MWECLIAGLRVPLAAFAQGRAVTCLNHLLHSGACGISRSGLAAWLRLRGEHHGLAYVYLDSLARACGTVNLISMCLLWNEYALI